MDLALAPGITGLLGPNGAGKTTMLRILATALAADRGSVRILGEDPTTTDGRVAVRRRLGYVPQETGFPRGFTAFAFVDYLAILKEWTDLPSRHEEVRRVIDQVGLTDVATKRVSALSGGQRRRVVLAQALLGRPDLLVLDEPTAGLDPAQRGRLRDVLGRAGETSTVVISTHQTEDVAALCERVVVLDGGRILFDGTVTDMVEPGRGPGLDGGRARPGRPARLAHRQRPVPQRRRPASVGRAHRAGPRGRLPAAGRRRGRATPRLEAAS